MLSLYQLSIPVFVRGFENLAAILVEGHDYALALSRDPSTLITARLAPDMLNLAGQVQRASDTAKGCAARLAGIPVPRFEDTESTFEDLQARINKTVDFLNGFSAAQIDDGEQEPILLQRSTATSRFAGRDYLLLYCLPSFYFHVSMAYAILRHAGVAISKKDYLGPL